MKQPFIILLGQVVQKVDNANDWINHYPVDSVVCFVNTYPRKIVIYPLDSVIKALNNRGLMGYIPPPNT